MKSEVAAGIEDLRRHFPDAAVTAREDGNGGAYVMMEPLALPENLNPQSTWLGFHIPAPYPYADIYPVFVGGDISRVDGNPLVAPVTTGHTFEGRPAVQISRRNSAAENGLQKASGKVLKVLDFLRRFPNA